jgi:glycosyltransferase involved in cell wall biosynthesis
MAKDAEATIGKCLDSLRPYVRHIVVGVDVNTKDRTAKVARKHGADLVFPLEVSDWHECPQHGQVRAQNFAAARNRTFDNVSHETDWVMWIDSDDVLLGSDRLAAMLADVPPAANVVWVKYNYATVNDGAAVTTVFDRERILRNDRPWVWSHRVHETVAPKVGAIQGWRTDLVVVQHQEGVHKSEHSSKRNELLLEIDWEENPNNARTAFYMAMGKFAQQDFAGAIEWFDKLPGLPGTNPFELWQSLLYMSMGYERLGQLAQARESAYLAIDTMPRYRDPYYQIANLCLLEGQFQKVVEWTAEGDRREDPPFFVFKNPMERSYNSRSRLADAHYQMGEIRQAQAALTEAHNVAPSERTAATLAHYAEIITAGERAEAFVRISGALSDAEKVRLYGVLPDDVRAFGRVRDLVAPIMLRERGLSAA